jgi:hypothetical protein
MQQARPTTIILADSKMYFGSSIVLNHLQAKAQVAKVIIPATIIFAKFINKGL